MGGQVVGWLVCLLLLFSILFF